MYTGTEPYITSASYLSCWTPPGSASTTVAGSGVETTPTLTDAVITATTLSISGSGSGSEPSKTEGSVSETISREESTITPETTTPPSAPTTAGVSGGEVTGSESGSGTAASTSTADNAGFVRGGSFVAVAGVMVGALAFV